MEEQVKQVAMEIIKEFMVADFKEIMKASEQNGVFQTRKEIRENCIFNKNGFYSESLISLLEQTNYFDDDGEVK